MSSEQPAAILIADASGLDFLNSIATPVDTPVDWMGTGEKFLDWLAQAKLVAPATAATLRREAQPGELDSVAAEARKLREWFRAFVREHKGRPLTGKDLKALEPLNRLLERDEIFHRIVATGQKQSPTFELETTRRWRSPESLLLPIAAALAKLVCEEDFTYVKACEGPTCTLMFADHTRGRARRWCSMAICGNRAKQIAHRSRAKAQR